MGCFSTCFGTCKPARRRRRRSIKTSPSLLQHLQTNQSIEDFIVPELVEEDEEHVDQEAEDIDNAENSTDLSPSIKNDEKGEKATLSGRKKVTFDLNVKVYENLSRDEEKDEENEYGRMNDEREIEDRKSDYKASCEGRCGSDSSSSSLFSFPPNHRYQNCRDSDDEFDEILSSDESEYTDDELDDYGEDGEGGVEDEVQSSESLFSLSMDSRKLNLGTGGAEKEVNSPIMMETATQNKSISEYDGRKYDDSVLNPVENLTQWKAIKVKSRLASRDLAKENMNSEPGFVFSVRKEVLQKEVAVDTSLSSWLGGSDKGTPKRSNSRNSSASVGCASADKKSVSPNKFEDRPILGALTLEEIRQMSAASTPRKSPTPRSPEDMPIIGSVGSYWCRTGQTNDSGSSTKSTKSRYRESAEVIWDSTPFETRLETALQKEANCGEYLAV